MGQQGPMRSPQTSSQQRRRRLEAELSIVATIDQEVSRLLKNSPHEAVVCLWGTVLFALGTLHPARIGDWDAIREQLSRRYDLPGLRAPATFPALRGSLLRAFAGESPSTSRASCRAIRG